MALDDDLYRELRDVYRLWKDDYGYNAARFIQKLERDGAVTTARDLVLSEGISRGFQELQTRGLLHLTVEAIVLRVEFRDLFNDAVLEAARTKLRNAGATFLGNA